MYMDKSCDRSYDNILDNIKRVHFIGIGGSGMCPLAEILIQKGYSVSGSDMNDGDTLQRIRETYDIKVYMGHKAENIDGAELVVYTAAVKDDNPELVSARQQNIPTIERSVMLGILSRKYSDTIAVAGTHGKTTTTAMISQILIGSSVDPTAVIGGKLPAIGGNSYVGKSEVMVCEACEYVDSFLQITPAVAVILNVDADHLDYFENLDNIKKSFRKFTAQTSKIVVVNGDDANSLECTNPDLPVLTFGFSDNCDYKAVMTSSSDTVYDSFDLFFKNTKICNINLSVPGKHNVYNALAAVAVCHYMGVSPENIAKNLNEFTGVHRRFEILGRYGGITIADDFAHHPTEITAALTAAKGMGFRKVWNIFQPHTFSRTVVLLDDFAKALSIADEAIILEILPVRETNTFNIYNTDIGKKVPGSKCIDTFEDATKYVCENAQDGDLILTMGGGNVYMCANMINDILKSKYSE